MCDVNGGEYVLVKNIYKWCDGEIWTKIPKRDFISHVWRRGRLALDPLQKIIPVFNAGLKDFGVLRVSVFLSLARSKMAIIRLPRALLKTSFFVFTSAEGKEPHFRLGSPPIICFIFLSPSNVRRPKVT